MESTRLSPAPPSAVEALPDRLSLPAAEADTNEKPGHKTRGEKLFDGFTYAGLAGTGTLLLSVASMYLMKYGSGKAGFGLSQRSWKQSWDHFAERFADAGMWKSVANTQLGQTSMFKFLHNPAALQRTAQRTLETIALGLFGGTIMMFPVERLERKKKGIVHNLNEKFSTPEEVAMGDARVQDEPPQTLGTLLKGRAVAFIVGFVALTGADILLAKFGKLALKPGSSQKVRDLAEKGLGAVSEWSGHGVGNLHAKIAPNAAPEKKLFWERIGNISAVDAVATVASTMILYVSSKFFSAQRSRKDGLKVAAAQGGMTKPGTHATGPVMTVAPDAPTPSAQPQPERVLESPPEAVQNATPEEIAARTGITLKSPPKARDGGFVAARQNELEHAQALEFAR